MKEKEPLRFMEPFISISRGAFLCYSLRKISLLMEKVFSFQIFLAKIQSLRTGPSCVLPGVYYSYAQGQVLYGETPHSGLLQAFCAFS